MKPGESYLPLLYSVCSENCGLQSADEHTDMLLHKETAGFSPQDIRATSYRMRFSDLEFRKRLWLVLCRDFFQKYVPENSTILDMAAGYCEFINSIKAKNKIVVDINPETRKYANKDVRVIVSGNTGKLQIKSESVDVVFQSNFFEHLTREDIFRTMKEIRRILKKGGVLISMNPNIRYSYRDFYMFHDHLTPLDDRGVREMLEVFGFQVMLQKAKFLPYTTKTRLPKPLFFLRIYLKFGILQKIFGKQMLFIAKKV